MRCLALVAALCALAATLPALARPASCTTTDDGTYPCDFQQFGGDGSFFVSAPMRPTYTLEVIDEGVGAAFADFGSGDRFLPGPFIRSQADGACWVSEATGFALCVD